MPALDAGHHVHVGCTLDNGSYVSGRLRSYSQVAEDTADRDLVLSPPIKVRPPGAGEAQEIQRVSWMTISARHIVTMAVTYVRKPPAALSPPSRATPAAQPVASAGEALAALASTQLEHPPKPPSGSDA